MNSRLSVHCKAACFMDASCLFEVSGKLTKILCTDDFEQSHRSGKTRTAGVIGILWSDFTNVTRIGCVEGVTSSKESLLKQFLTADNSTVNMLKSKAAIALLKTIEM